METKPFNLQSPEQIANDYGGNKQKIAQAANMGMVDPTAAVLAGMFIDRMRSAQVMEQAPSPTVAQQVLAPAGPPPSPGAPTANPPQMPPQGTAPPMGLASGGLASLPIPDNMFDEPMGVSDSYAGGGLVSFAGGGVASSGMTPAVAQNYFVGQGWSPAQAAGIVGNLQAESAFNHSAVGDGGKAYGLAQWHPDRQANFERVFGKPMTQATPMEQLAFVQHELTQGNEQRAGRLLRRANDPQQAARIVEQHYERPAAGSTNRRASAAQNAYGSRQPIPPPAPPPPQAPEIDSHGRGLTLDVANEDLNRIMGSENTQDRDAYRAAVAKDLDPAEMDKRKKQDLWSTLAQIGFGMASSNSPNFLQAVGQAGAAALPGMQDSIKARRDAERAARRDLMATEEMGNKSQRERGSQVIEYQGNNANTYDAAQAAAAKAAFDAQKLQTEVDMNTEDNQSRERMQNSSNRTQLAAASIAASGRPQTNAAELEAQQIQVLAENRYREIYDNGRQRNLPVTNPQWQAAARRIANSQAVTYFQQLQHPGRQNDTNTNVPGAGGLPKNTPRTIPYNALGN